MKKSVVIAALGLAAGAMTSFGQGSMTFNSYLANSSAGVPVYLNTVGGSLLGAGYTADLAYSTTAFTDTAGNGNLNGSLSLSASSLFNVATPFGTSGATLGYFQSPHNFSLSPYTAGTTVYFEVIAYNGSSYANATIRGHSASFSTTLATGSALPVDIGAAGFTSFAVSAVTAVPEPTTLALAGLGGLASLVALRRKQA